MAYISKRVKSFIGKYRVKRCGMGEDGALSLSPPRSKRVYPVPAYGIRCPMEMPFRPSPSIPTISTSTMRVSK